MSTTGQTWLKLSVSKDKYARLCTFLLCTYPSFVVSATAAINCTVLGLWWMWVCSPRYFWTKSLGVMNLSPSLSTTLAYWGQKQQNISNSFSSSHSSTALGLSDQTWVRSMAEYRVFKEPQPSITILYVIGCLAICLQSKTFSPMHYNSNSKLSSNWTDRNPRASECHNHAY